MGLFSFVKDVGAKIFGSKPANAETLQKELAGHGLPADVGLEVNGDQVKVTGAVMSQEEAERIILALGNTVGVATVDASSLVANDGGAQSTMYTVKKGDTLWKIAEMHYGKGKGGDYPKIVEANSPPVKNPDLIQPGWVLRIPAA